MLITGLVAHIGTFLRRNLVRDETEKAKQVDSLKIFTAVWGNSGRFVIQHSHSLNNSALSWPDVTAYVLPELASQAQKCSSIYLNKKKKR